MPKRKKVYKAIDTEREYQDLMWEDSAAGPRHSVGEDLFLIEQLMRQAGECWQYEHRPETETLEYLRKIAGVCVRCMEAHGAPKRKFDD